MGGNNPFTGPIRRTEIPLYTEDVIKFRQEAFPVNKKAVEPFFLRKALDDTFASMGQQVREVRGKYHDDYVALQDTINTGISHASVTLDFLREEENILPRAGAVAVAGLAGLVLGLRGGFFRKLFYTSAAATGMAGLCYPQLAVEYSKDLVANSKKYAAIGYNFIQGATPEEKPAKIPLTPGVPKAATGGGSKKTEIKGDMGQSNPEDKDMYTTRS